MVAKIARLALPFTDTDMVDHVDVRISILGSPETVTIALPSVDGVSGVYYNGGDLGTGDTTTFTTPHDSMIMALAMAIATAAGGIDVVVTEDPLLGGRYVIDGDVNTWEILWSDPLTTAEPRWFGFANRRSASDGSGIITADYQADRLFIAVRPRWNRKKRVRVASVTQGYSDTAPPQVRSYGTGHKPWSLSFSMVAGARFYKWDAEDPTLGAHVFGAVAGSIAVSAAVVDKGTGYLVDDKLTLVDGVTGAAGVFNVDTRDTFGEVLTVSPDDTPLDVYTTKPTAPTAVTTDGGGSGCTLAVTWEDGDPNVCLEELWEWVTKRLPIKVIEDAGRLTEYAMAMPRDPAWINDLDSAILVVRSEAPPYFDIELPLQQHGGAIASGGGFGDVPPGLG